MHRHRRPPACTRVPRGRRGQSLVEFALVAPLLIAVIFSIVEAGLLLYVFNSAQHAGTMAQETIAAEGSLTTADLDAVDSVHKTDFGTSGLITITQYNVFMLSGDGSNTRDADSCPAPSSGTEGCFMVYSPTGVAATAPNCVPSQPLGTGSSVTTPGGITLTKWGNWEPSTRPTSVSTASYVEVDICYDYRPFGLQQQTMHLVVQRFFRLEPQSS